DVLPIEINPRLQGSSWVLAEVEQALGQTPLGAIHRGLLLEEPPSREARRGRFDTPAGAFLILHHFGEPCALARTPRIGIHRVQERGLRFLRQAIGLLDCNIDEIYVEGFPATGHTVEIGAAVARVASWRRLAEPDG